MKTPTRHRTHAIFLVAVFAVASTAPCRAVPFSISGIGGFIPDNNEDGQTFELTIPSGLEVLGSGNNVTLSLLNFNHPVLFDLTVTLEHVGFGPAQTVFDQVLTSTGLFTNNPLDGNYSFDSGAAQSLQDFADDRGQITEIDPGTYRATLPDDSTTSEFSSFWNGQAANGTWRMVISDRNSTGSIANTTWSWRLDLGVRARWNVTATSTWDDPLNWVGSSIPGENDDPVINPAVSLGVLGPASDTTVSSLTVGGGNGLATLSLNGGVLTANSDVVIAATGVLTGDGVIDANVANHGTITANNVTITGTLSNHQTINGFGWINAALDNTTSGRVRVGTLDHLIFNGPSNTNAGQIETIGGQVEFTHHLANTTGRILARDAVLRFNGGLSNDGDLAVSFGVTDVFGDMVNQADGRIVLQGNANVTFWDDVVNNGSITVDTASRAVFFGETSGSGSFPGAGPVTFNGVFSPGNSPGEAAFGGDLVLGDSAELIIELAGLTGGSEHDRLSGNGSFTANGALTITLLDNFQPRPGDRFDLFDFGDIRGVFSQINLPPLHSDRRFDTSQLYSTGRLTVIPEPAAALLLAAGLCLMRNPRWCPFSVVRCPQ